MPHTTLPTHPNQLPQTDTIIRVTGITKRFPGVLANDDVSLSVRRATFHALIGENGAGKSTLLNILYGRYPPDAGSVVIANESGIEENVTRGLRSPLDAIRLGVGLVSQHYALIPALSVIDNVILGAEATAGGFILNRRAVAEKIADLSARLGLTGVDLNARTESLSVAAQQKVEILKALYRGARVLLLDEPTATLAPQEAGALFDLLAGLVDNGTTVVFVTHKLKEVRAHSDCVTVLRAGRNAGDFTTADTSDAQLVAQMIGERHTAAVGPTMNAGTSSASAGGRPVLRIAHLSVRNARNALAVEDVSLDVWPGQIVGIAGVDGSGQRELAEAVVGLRRPESGSLILRDGTEVEMRTLSVRQRRGLGVAYIPEDRHASGMVMDFSVAENYLLGHESESAWGGGAILSRVTMARRARQMADRYDVRLGGRDVSVAGKSLSGGNQQKMVVARALDSAPRLLVGCQPTRGLDRGATEFVYSALRQAAAGGAAVLLFSLDLDEVLELSDRIMVMFNGRIAGTLSHADATPERVGALMLGAAPEIAGEVE